MGKEQNKRPVQPENTQQHALTMFDGTPISIPTVFSEIMERIQPDGSVYVSRAAKKRKWQPQPEDVIDVTQFTPERRERYKLSLADNVFRYLSMSYRYYALDKTWSRSKNDEEFALAMEFSRVRAHPDFIGEVQHLVEEAVTTNQQPSVLVQVRKQHQ
jgi:hypothetical protein